MRRLQALRARLERVDEAVDPVLPLVLPELTRVLDAETSLAIGWQPTGGRGVAEHVLAIGPATLELEGRSPPLTHTSLRAVAGLLAEGLSDKEIAACLGRPLDLRTDRPAAKCTWTDRVLRR